MIPLRLLNPRPSSQSPALDGPPVQVRDVLATCTFGFDVQQRLTRVIADALETPEGPALQAHARNARQVSAPQLTTHSAPE